MNQKQVGDLKIFLKLSKKIPSLQNHYITQHQDLNASTQKDSEPPPPPKITDFTKHTLTGGIDELQFSHQPIGKFDDKSITEAFKFIRHEHVKRITLEENRVLLRLEKLSSTPSLPSNERRDYEKSVVNWVKDEDCPICPFCGEKFSIWKLSLPHHCRLCGSIMCEKCCLELSYQNAMKILKVCHVPSCMGVQQDDINKVFYDFKVCNYCNDVLQRKYQSAVLIENSDVRFLNIYSNFFNIFKKIFF